MLTHNARCICFRAGRETWGGHALLKRQQLSSVQGELFMNFFKEILFLPSSCFSLPAMIVCALSVCRGSRRLLPLSLGSHLMELSKQMFGTFDSV